MKNSKDHNIISSKPKIEKILGHKIITEYDPIKKKYNYFNKYKIKWVGCSEPKWELESKLEKYKKTINNYKKIYENEMIEKNLPEKENSTSLYSEYNMRLDESVVSSSEKKKKKKLNNKIISIEESSSEIIESENEYLTEEKDKNLIEDKKNLKDKQKNKIKLFNSEYLKFGPKFEDVLKAGNTKNMKDKEHDNNLLNKKRKNNDLMANLNGKNSEQNSNDSNNLTKIYQIIIPPQKNENISVILKRKNKEKNLIIKEEANSQNVQKEELLKCYEHIIKTNLNKIPKEELLNFYEQIIKKYLAGNTYNFD